MDIHQSFQPRMPSFNLRDQLADMKDFLRRHRKAILILALGVFLFYWFEIRPININNYCSAEASANARLLLRSKAEVATDAATKQSYQQLVAKDMYLRSDHESFFA